jgi:hypothetical protein
MKTAPSRAIKEMMYPKKRNICIGYRIKQIIRKQAKPKISNIINNITYKVYMNGYLSISPLIIIQQVTVNILGSLVPLIHLYTELLARGIICQAAPLTAR